ncbi:hypothetical protein NHX12_015146 [Muraenolepis orangiensis]|uniref:Uncharacterized protein n=1 Tax=Muraenolepis orangiensis TaxID=630683 RepID=A0A9Q0I5T1_9TELE|nr:hypothetical protein NHX12_015146 [Muraenolepis orangiensis]
MKTPIKLCKTAIFHVYPFMFLSVGSDFLCTTHIIPVKNEEGVVILFILNFDYVLDESSSDSLEKLNHASPSKTDQRRSTGAILEPYPRNTTPPCPTLGYLKHLTWPRLPESATQTPSGVKVRLCLRTDKPSLARLSAVT